LHYVNNFAGLAGVFGAVHVGKKRKAEGIFHFFEDF